VVLIDSITDGIRFIDNNYLVLPQGYDAPVRLNVVLVDGLPPNGIQLENASVDLKA